LGLIERYPEYIFGASQPQLYMFVKAHYPTLYERVKQAVADGRFEPQGAMWVEADCNIISGESMVRQVLHGKNFYRDEFGVDVRNLWIPDVFGYSAAMPQIMQRAGVDYFLTQKLSWSQFNRFPHTTFRWFGIDGSELLTHFPPEDTYNSRLCPSAMRGAEQKFEEKGYLDEAMCLFGIGDGGAGPKPEQIERGLRQRDLEGVPRVQFSRADAFFDRLAERRDSLPAWQGELYLELHRGTLTTQGRTKRGNRKLELALRATEYLCALLPADAYPRDVLDRTWKQLLTNQFHDILPGSSIHRVYTDAEQDYADGLDACASLTESAAAELFEADQGALTVVNTLNVPVTQPIALPDGWTDSLVSADGTTVAVQKDADGKCVAAVTVPSQGVVTLERSGAAQEASVSDDLVLENDLVRYEFAEDGRLVGAFDKECGREVLAHGTAGNVLSLYEDRPNNWDAWDIDVFYEHQLLEQAKAVTVVGLGQGAVRQGIRFELSIGQSALVQDVYLAAHSKRLDFRTMVDWQERHRMLRVAFPVNVRSDQACFEIQYGHVKRNTHRNVSWDMAKFEVAAQRYADLSDAQYGVALLNDCKYGHKIHENVLDLNLLRSPTHPDPDADLGEHRFTYSLLPHADTLVESGVMAEAAQLNQPPLVFAGRRGSICPVPVSVTGEGVALEVLKRAEKSDERVIRLVEQRGFRTEAVVACAGEGARLVETDLMEWNDGQDWGGGSVTVPMAPFEIRTFRLVGE
jgi:alpha-mannosidase